MRSSEALACPFQKNKRLGPEFTQLITLPSVSMEHENILAYSGCRKCMKINYFHPKTGPVCYITKGCQ